MLQKLKDLGEAAKNLVIYVFTPLAFFIGYVYYLLNKNKELNTRLDEEKADGKLKGLKDEDKAASERASNAVSEYERLRGAYLRDRTSRMFKGGGGAEGTDSDQDPDDNSGGTAS